MIAVQNTLPQFDVNDTGSGLECFFIKYKTFGVKLYGCEEEANRVASRQRTASKHGLGPEVLSEVISYNIPYDMGQIIIRQRPHLKGPVLYGYETDLAEVGMEVKGSEIQRLCARFLALIGCVLYDCGSSNVGFKNSELVLIDFGDCSFEDDF